MKPPYPANSWPSPGGEDDPSPYEPDFLGLSAGAFGLALFLVSLSVLFVASLVAFIMVRYFGPTPAPPPALHLPPALWGSTVALLLATGAFHLALRSARQQRPGRLRLAVGAAFALGAAFIAIQTPALLQLLDIHSQLVQQRTAVYGLTFTLIVLHAVHVIAGMIPLTWVAVQAAHKRLGGNDYRFLRATAAYWHFLDVVWIVMFGTFLVAG